MPFDKNDPFMLKEVWREEIKGLLEELTTLSFKDYSRKLAETKDSFCNFFEKNQDKIMLNQYETVGEFLKTYKKAYEQFYDCFAMDAVLDQKDPFSMYSNPIDKIKVFHKELTDEELWKYMNIFFKNGRFDENIFPKVLYPRVIEEIEDSIVVYNHIKHYQDSNKKVYEKYMPLLHQLDYFVLSLLLGAGVTPEDGMYLKVDEKISKIQEWLNCLKKTR